MHPSVRRGKFRFGEEKMKKSFLIRAVAATFLFAAVFFGAGCKQNDDDGSNESSDATVVAAVKSALDVGYAIGDSASSVTQNVTLTITSGDVTILWSSNNTAVIANDGTVTLPASDTQVTLTATLTCGSSSDKTTFALTVINKTRAETLKALEITYATGDSATCVTQNVTLPTTLSSYTVTWESNHTKNITTAGVVARDIVDVSVTLSATVKDGTTTIATKEFVLTVKQVAQVTYTNTYSKTTKYTFTSGTITYTYTDSSKSSYDKGYTYTFTADTDAGTLTATMTGITTDGTSYTKDEYTTYLIDGWSAYVTFYKPICEDNDVTYDDLISGGKACYQLEGGSSDEASEASWLYGMIYGDDDSITDYAAALKAKATLTADSHTAFNGVLTKSGYSSWDDALTGLAAEVKTQADEMFFSTKTYSYTLGTTTDTTYYTDGYVFDTHTVYDTTNGWWEQATLYFDYTNGNGNLFYYNSDEGWSFIGQKGTLSEDHTTFTETTSSKKWAISSNGKGTLTLTNESTSYTVTFEGNNLSRGN